MMMTGDEVDESNYHLSEYIITFHLPLSVLILVLLLVSLITVMFYVNYLISQTHLCFIVFCHCISY